jgi:PTH2 family peptidyl-tRNA hydrolase
MVKQMLVVRKDLNMRKGKIGVQSAHASLKVFFDRIVAWDFTHKNQGKIRITMEITPAMYEWVTGCFTKIEPYVESEEALLNLYKRAKESDIPCALILDAGLTEFGGVPTYTAVAIGPDYNEKIDTITGGLPLL